MSSNEAFSRARIDEQLRDAGWSLTDGRSVRFEHPLPDRTRADYVLCDRRGQALAVVEAKRASRALGEAEPQALAYASALKVPFVFLVPTARRSGSATSTATPISARWRRSSARTNWSAGA
jgi:type I restriction enzyme R subunit